MHIHYTQGPNWLKFCQKIAPLSNYEEYSGDEDGSDDDSEDPNAKFHYIITEEDTLGPEIPKFTKLKSTLPNENPIQYRRSFPAALRFHKVNRDNHPHKFLGGHHLYMNLCVCVFVCVRPSVP